MTPARSVTARVVALGFASAMTAPLPAFAAPVPCDRPEHYAAQSGAELLRINRLDLRPATGNTPRRADPAKPSASGEAGSPGDVTPSGTADSGGDEGGGTGDESGTGDRGGSPSRSRTAATAGDTDGPEAGRRAGAATGGRDGGGGSGGGAENRVVGEVGIGETRSVLIADGPVNSAGAARLLNGQITGSTERNDVVVQQAPPVNPKPGQRRTGAKTFGPIRVGAGSLGAHAVWAAGMECGSVEGEAAGASAEIGRVMISGGGSGALVRVPEKISSRSSTALRQRAGTPQTVASATMSAGRISLVDNEVRLRVLRAPELRASMTMGGKAQVDYLPAVVEVSSRGGKQARLATAGDHIDIALSENMRPLESLPGRLDPIGKLPLPKIPNLPVPGAPENAPAPAGRPGSTLRISLGKVRQAAEGDAIAARATAIRVTVIRNDDKGRTLSGNDLSGLVADLGIGMLEAAAVAPGGSDSGLGVSPPGPGVSPAGPGVPSAGSRVPPAGSRVSPDGPGLAGGPAVGVGTAGLPATGPRAISLFIAGAGLVIGGICVLVLTSRRRRDGS